MNQSGCTRRTFLATAGLTALGASPLRAVTAANYEKVVLAKKPVGYWRLGESSGPAAADAGARSAPRTWP